MTKQDNIKALINAVDDYNTACGKLHDILYVDFGNPLMAAVNLVIDVATAHYTEAEQGWIDWYMWANDFGRQKEEVEVNGDVVVVESVEDLFAVMWGEFK